MWELTTFRNPFITALVVFGKQQKIKRVSIGPEKLFVNILGTMN
jgi:hypothetical protein